MASAERPLRRRVLAAEVLDFWFAAPGSEERRDIWFKSTAEFDAEIRRRFLAAHEAAAKGEVDALAETPVGCLALIIQLDQFPRNLFRGTARAFATDQKALAFAKQALEADFAAGLDKWRRLFLGLPFVHSEDPADQEIGVQLAEKLDEERSLTSAREHRDIIARFGRFPHRNTALGRANTAEEEEYLSRLPKTFGQGGEQN